MSNRVSIPDILQATKGILLSSGTESSFPLQIQTDTRKAAEGDLFIALVGPRYNPHQYLEQAIENGARTLIVQESCSFKGVNVIFVPDTLQALQDLARYWRGQLTDRSIGITGSSGKTTTKDLTHAVLSQRFQTQSTRGNYNNHIGLPLTILRNSRSDEACIYEMGMNHPGEIAPLCSLCVPKIGIITNIGSAHIENMKTIDAIADEKAALARSLPEDGTLIIPTDIQKKSRILEQAQCGILEVGIDTDTLISARNLNHCSQGTEFQLTTPAGTTQVLLPLRGTHMVHNALLAAAAGHLYGLSPDDIAQGLEQVITTSGRLREYSYEDLRIFDDTYNANPDSMKAAFRTVKEVLEENQNGYLVLGAMAELGAHALTAYKALGQYGAELGLTIIAIGPETQLMSDECIRKGGDAMHFQTQNDAIECLSKRIPKNSVILFKGSRSSAMETVMNTLYPQSK